MAKQPQTLFIFGHCR